MTFTCWSHDTATVQQEVEEEVGPAVEQQLKESHEREQEMNAHIQRLESQLERVSQSPDKIIHFDVTTSLLFSKLFYLIHINACLFPQQQTQIESNENAMKELNQRLLGIQQASNHYTGSMYHCWNSLTDKLLYII